MEVLLGRSKAYGNIKSASLRASIPLVVQENLHVVEGDEIFLYLEDGLVYIETAKRDSSSYGISKSDCFLGSKVLVPYGAVLGLSFSHVLKEVLGLSVGDFLGYYFKDGRIHIKKYVKNS